MILKDVETIREALVSGLDHQVRPATEALNRIEAFLHNLPPTEVVGSGGVVGKPMGKETK